MNLYALLRGRSAEGRPVRVGLIGAGKFSSMFLAQARITPGIHVMAVADLSAPRALQALRNTDWPEQQISAASFAQALSSGTTHVTEDVEALIATEGIDVVVEATGNPAAGIHHALRCFHHGRHLVMVNVEADALAGPLLSQRAREAGVVYSLAYGDQPALICELVDWARASGFEVVCAGKGTKYLPEYHTSTPEAVWQHFAFTEEQIESGQVNAQMFNSFIDGTKSAVEMAAVANATGLTPSPEGLGFPPAGMDGLAEVCRPRQDGGSLHHVGTVEVVSSLERDGSLIADHLQQGVYVTFKAATDYATRCFSEYGVTTDESGAYAAMFRPFHLIGLELGISVAAVALRGHATGAPTGFRGDVVAVAKRALSAGERLDGEGGYTVYGRLTPAEDSLRLSALPMGLASGIELREPVAAGEIVTWSDVAIDESQEPVRFRREMERWFRTEGFGEPSNIARVSSPSSKP
jgi:predicted homoserine dehydrogenase-like protein